MWNKIWQSSWALAIGAGLAAVFAFPPFNIAPLVIGCPWLLGIILLRERIPLRAAIFGLVASLAIMIGAFYWVVYVLHEFGYLPWIVAALVYVLFCGFGALNFPLFTFIASACAERLGIPKRSPRILAVWYCAALPALFSAVEWLVPKLFPWYVGHAFFQTFWINQIVEITGCSYLTFLVFSSGGLLALLTEHWSDRRQFFPVAGTICGWLWIVGIGFSLYRLGHPWPVERPIRIALIQANIGSLEKVEARRGIVERVRYVVDKYIALTDAIMRQTPHPDLVLWPETAVPFALNNSSSFAEQVKDAVIRWNVPLITGGYISSYTHADRDYNAAYLLEPAPGGHLAMDVYRKNILLAFGEYLPLADRYPALYNYLPQVSNFERGVTQNPYQLRDGTRIGVTICYEAIVPSFFRKVARQHVQFVVNLTNDSWFGPTAEPLLHASLAVFRAIETRLPLARVTNTGISFTVDSVGHMSPTTGVYQDGTLVSEIRIPQEAPQTFYLRWGDWFVAVCASVFAGCFLFFWRGRQEALPK